MSEPQIELVGVTRTFEVRRRAGLRRRTRRAVALSEVSFGVGTGEAVGCLGTSGAGKSTMIQIVAGLLTPTAGYVRTDGLMPVHQQAELGRRVGLVLGSRPQLRGDQTLAASLRLLAELRRLPAGRWQLRQDELVDQLDLGRYLRSPLRLLTAGPRMRAEVAAALLHEPGVVILDEPTAGLDMLSKERLRAFLRHENRVHRRTVLLGTQDLGDLERLCDRVLVLDRGRLAYDGTLPDLVERAGGRRVLVVDLIEPGPELTGLAGVEVISVESQGRRQRLALRPGGTSAAHVLAEVTGRADVREVTLLEPAVDDIVRSLHHE